MSTELNPQEPSHIDKWRMNLATKHPELWKAVEFVLGLFDIAGIVKPKDCRFDIADPNKVAFYVEDCLHENVTVATLIDQHAEVRRSMKFWPTPSEFARAFAGKQSASAIIPAGCTGYVISKGNLIVVDTRLRPDAVSEHEAMALLGTGRRALTESSSSIQPMRVGDANDVIITDEDIKRHEGKVKNLE